MSLISTKGVYGILAIYEIAKATSQNPISINEISNTISVSKGYLEQLLNPLKTAGYLDEVKSLISEFMQYDVQEEGLSRPHRGHRNIVLLS